MSNLIDMDTVIRMLLPNGPIYEPEEHVEISLGNVELITNGDFPTTINGWTAVENGGTVAWNANSGGSMRIRTNAGA